MMWMTGTRCATNFQIRHQDAFEVQYIIYINIDRRHYHGVAQDREGSTAASERYMERSTHLVRVEGALGVGLVHRKDLVGVGHLHVVSHD